MDENIYELEEAYDRYAGLCECGMRTVLARIENLRQEMELNGERNPYAAIEPRIKSFESVMEKCERKGFARNIDSICKNVRDVAGIRIITLYEDDIYRVRDALIRQPSMVVVEEKDYVANPKKNGYRSLHLLVQMHVYFCETTKSVPIEIQIRTKAMDLWASVEHDCRYKNTNPAEAAPEIFNKIAQILNDFDEAAVHLRDNTTV